jgi:cell division septum initiation protein DivIVA
MSVHNEEAMTKPLTPQQIRDADLPKARRGFEEEATRKLLADAAGALSTAFRERDDLLKQVADLSKQAAENPTDAETIGAVLMVAHRAGEDLLAQAADEAAQIQAGAERERDELLVQARGQIEALVAEAGAGIQALRDEDADLRRSIATNRQELADFLRSSLAQLEEVDSFGPHPAAHPVEPRALDGELFLQLPSE